jgi:hypothetical protein
VYSSFLFSCLLALSWNSFWHFFMCSFCSLILHVIILLNSSTEMLSSSLSLVSIFVNLLTFGGALFSHICFCNSSLGIAYLRSSHWLEVLTFSCHLSVQARMCSGSLTLNWVYSSESKHLLMCSMNHA